MHTTLKRFAISASLIAFGLTATISSAQAETFRWAGKTDPQTMDPHATNTAPVLGFLNNIYEGLVRRNKEMKIEGSLATSWEPLGAEGWRFNLRKDVTFHDGSAFTADDVLFSYERASSEESDVRTWFASVTEVTVVDDHTIDFMDRDWATSNDALLPSKEAENFATRNTNGTAAFMLKSRDPGVRTVLAPNTKWWGDMESNITEAIFTPIGQAATGMAALLSGEIDFISPIPLQDVPRMKEREGFTVHEGVEARVLMFGFAQQADSLKFSEETSGKNPFQDQRVRQAAYMSIDVDTLIAKIMRGNAQPASQLVSSAMRGYSNSMEARLPYDPAKAKALLADAGYADGFSFGLQCPNDRYINDEAICKAAASMMSKVGLNAKLTAMPVRNYWPELRGWSPGTFDAEHPIRFLASTPNKEKKLGSWNFGDYSNARVDELLPQLQTELDDTKRQAMIDEVTGILQEDVAYIPMYVQPLIWASTDKVELTQRTDNFFILRWVTVN